MPTYRECRVYYRDYGGVEHAVYLQAVHRWQAFGLAMVRLRKCSWSNPDFSSVQKLTVQLLGGHWRKVIVTREEFEGWLGKKGGEDERERKWLRMALGREPPDRDFIAGHRH